MNEEIFFSWLQILNAFRVPGKCLLVLDGHSFHCFLECLAFREQHDIELLCLSPHTTHILQALDRTVFKTLKTYFHSEATKYIHNQPSGRISKFNFGELFRKAWHRTAIPAHAEKGFECTGIFPYNSDVIPKEKFFHRQYSLHRKTHQCQFLEDLLQRPQNWISARLLLRPNTGGNRKQKSRLLTPKDNISACRAKRQIKTLKGQQCKKPQNNTRAGHVHTLPPEVEHESSSAKDNPCEMSANCEDDDTLCSFCGLRYNYVESIKRGDWIACQQSSHWYHEVCVGAFGKNIAPPHPISFVSSRRILLYVTLKILKLSHPEGSQMKKRFQDAEHVHPRLPFQDNCGWRLDRGLTPGIMNLQKVPKVLADSFTYHCCRSQRANRNYSV
ncbi:hypothetical protein PR048_010020, partial [Dryococelus australis]